MRYLRLCLLLVLLTLFFIFLYSNSSGGKDLAILFAWLVGSLTDPIMITGIILLSILLTWVSNFFRSSGLVLSETATIILFVIGSFILAVLINYFYINPFRYSIGADASPNLLRAICIFIYAYLINGIITRNQK